MRRRLLPASILLLACACQPTRARETAASSPTASRTPALAALLERGRAKGYPGVAMLVQRADGTTASAAVGYSDLEHHTPLSVDDAFPIASINKTFTAVATLRLVDEGKLALTATLSDLLGDAVRRIPFAERITVAHLLDHSSGIYATNNDADYLGATIGLGADPRRVWTPAELVALADRDRRRPSGEPGSGHYYADTNYVLLGMIVEKASGRPFKQFIAKTIFEPLAMHATYFRSDELDGTAHPRSHRVQGYLLATAELRKAVAIHPMFKPVVGESSAKGELLNTTLASERIDAAAGIVSTLPDMARYATALFRGRLLSVPSQKWIMSVGQGMESRPVGDERTRALQAVRKPYGVVVFKEGDGPGGINTLMAYLPSKDEIYLAYTNVFGNFDEVKFMLDEVVAPLARE